MESYPLLQIDAFTDRPFAGNPAAVCILPKPQTDQWMQAVAAEMNLSETAFVTPHADPFKRAWQLRWFTPVSEVQLCGHATLATAHALWTEGYLRPDELAKFDTLSGRLTCTYDQSGWITMDFPALAYEELTMPAGLLDALGVADGRYFRNAYNETQHRAVVMLERAEQVRALRPDSGRLAAFPAMRGLIVTAEGDGQFDIVSRYFAPLVGIPEDPVTGSAHCLLSPIWAAELGKTELLAYQASARGGILKLSLNGDRVALQGQAVTVLKGTLVG